MTKIPLKHELSDNPKYKIQSNNMNENHATSGG